MIEDRELSKEKEAPFVPFEIVREPDQAGGKFSRGPAALPFVMSLLALAGIVLVLIVGLLLVIPLLILSAIVRRISSLGRAVANR